MTTLLGPQNKTLFGPLFGAYSDGGVIVPGSYIETIESAICYTGDNKDIIIRDRINSGQSLGVSLTFDVPEASHKAYLVQGGERTALPEIDGVYFINQDILATGLAYIYAMDQETQTETNRLIFRVIAQN